MRKAFVILITVLTLSAAVPAIAEEGRYQAIEISKIDKKADVLIIDTKEGHLLMWILLWEPEKGPSTHLFYQGKVYTRRTPGEPIYRTPLQW